MAVDPIRVVLESDYFINQIRICEESRDAEIERIEAGIHDDTQSVRDLPQPGDEWLKLQTMPNDEYLMKTILPVLYQGMKVVELERPNAPLECLAVYLLQN